MDVDGEVGEAGDLGFSSYPMVQRFFDKLLQEEAVSLSDRLEIDLRTCCMGHVQTVIIDNSELGPVKLFWGETLEACQLVVSRCATAQIEGNETASSHVAPIIARLAPSINHFRKIPVIVLEDILDTLSAESAFAFWKSVVDPSCSLFSKVMWDPEPKKHPCWLPFLKAANKFLHRLRTEGPTNDALGFAPISAVLQTLSAVYPISEKSATRAFGSHNSDHLTVLESELEYEDQRQQLREPEQKPSKKSEKQKPPASYSYYKTLWMLQHDFRNPNGISVVEFMRRLTAVLRSFQTTSSGNKDDKATEVVTDAHLAPYTTKSQLLPIQLKDPAIRTTVLTQFWIVAQHLMSQVPSMKKQLEPHLRTTETLLPKSHLDLLKHSSLLQHSEKQWSDWKKKKCQYDLDATKPPSAFVPGKRKQPPQDDTTESSAKVHHPPTEEVSKKMRSCEPSVKDYMEPYVDAIDPEAGIEDEYHPKRDAVFAWRALRRLGDSNLEGILDVQPDGDFEIMVRKLYESEYDIAIPGECPKQVEFTEEAEAEEEDPMEVEIVEQTEPQKPSESNEEKVTKEELPKKDLDSNGGVEMKAGPSDAHEDDAQPDQKEAGPVHGPATLSETNATATATVVKIEDDEDEVGGGADQQPTVPTKPRDEPDPKKTVATNKQSKTNEARPAVSAKGSSSKSKALDFQPKESAPRSRGSEPLKTEPHRRGHPQFHPRIPERRDMHPRPDDRMGGPDDRSRPNNERGRPVDRPRLGERPRHHDDRSRSRNDDRRGDGRRGDGRGGWRQGERRR